MTEHEFTPDQIEDAVAHAVKDREFSVIPSLVRLLAVQSPERAQRVLDALQGRYTVDLSLREVAPMTAAPEPRCERSELLVSQCDHCRPKPPAAKPEISYRFDAMYPGRCSICDYGFDEEARIGRLLDGDLACPDCCEELT